MTRLMKREKNVVVDWVQEHTFPLRPFFFFFSINEVNEIFFDDVNQIRFWGLAPLKFKMLFKCRYLQELSVWLVARRQRIANHVAWGERGMILFDYSNSINRWGKTASSKGSKKDEIISIKEKWVYQNKSLIITQEIFSWYPIFNNRD